jgi:hypothetical protein
VMERAGEIQLEFEHRLHARTGYVGIRDIAYMNRRADGCGLFLRNRYQIFAKDEASTLSLPR